MIAFIPTLALRAGLGVLGLAGITGLAASGVHTLRSAAQTATSTIASLPNVGASQPTIAPAQPERWVAVADYSPTR